MPYTLVLQPQLASTLSAFALWCHGHSAIVTWGRADYGGNSSPVQDQLTGVMHIQATKMAFAAILADTSVLSWGSELWRWQFGSSRSAPAFAAILCRGRTPLHRRAAKACSRSKQQLGPVAAVRDDCNGDSSSVQKKVRLGLFSPVFFLPPGNAWAVKQKSFSSELPLGLVWWIKRIASNAARDHALFCLATERGGKKRIHHGTYGAHRIYMKSQSCWDIHFGVKLTVSGCLWGQWNPIGRGPLYLWHPPWTYLQKKGGKSCMSRRSTSKIHGHHLSGI